MYFDFIEKIQNNEKKHYAFLLSKKVEIARGQNSYIKDNTCTTIHAELDALRKIAKLRQYPKILDILVINLDKNNNLREAKPCVHCISILHNSKYKIKNVFYSTKVNNEYCIVQEKFSKMISYDNMDKKITSKSLRYKCGEKVFYT